MTAVEERLDQTEVGRASGTPRRSRRRLWVVLATAVVVIGVAGRTLVADGSAAGFLGGLLPWLDGTTVTLYFGDDSGSYMVPVTRTLTGDDESPQALVEALLAGPGEGSGLLSLIPDGTVVRMVSFDGRALEVDVSPEYAASRSILADEALLQTLGSWPGAEEVSITVDGRPLQAAPGHLLYFYEQARDRLVATPTPASSVSEILDAYLTGPSDDRLVGLPADVEVLELRSAPGSSLLRLDMTYTSSVRTFALEDGDAMRRVLEGLLATLTTGFSDTRYVYLDFEGQATLGLGQCSNLLRRAQPPPSVLNPASTLQGGV